MGNDQTTLSHKDTNSLSIDRYVEISAKHNKKIYIKNIKTFKEFSLIARSISVRVSYLKYDWAKWLKGQIEKNLNKVYEQYCLVFKQGLMKKNEQSSSFHPYNFDFKFLQSFIKNAKRLQTSKFTTLQLQSLFEQVKCYFMVSNWFIELPLNSNLKNNQATQCTKQNDQFQKSVKFSIPKKAKASQDQSNEQKVYRILLKLTQIYFDNTYYDKQHNNRQQDQCQSPKMNPIKRFNKRQAHLIKSISKEASFKERQEMISQLLDLLLDKENHRKVLSDVEGRKMFLLTKILGLRNVYCVLKVLKQVGSANNHLQKIEVIFQHIVNRIICQESYPEVQVHQNKTSAKQSPVKRNHSKNPSTKKTRKQSLR